MTVFSFGPPSLSFPLPPPFSVLLSDVEIEFYGGEIERRIITGAKTSYQLQKGKVNILNRAACPFGIRLQESVFSLPSTSEKLHRGKEKKTDRGFLPPEKKEAVNTTTQHDEKRTGTLEETKQKGVFALSDPKTARNAKSFLLSLCVKAHFAAFNLSGEGHMPAS